MTDKALILGGPDVLDETPALPRGVRVELQREDGVLVTGSSGALEELASGPGRVKLLRDTNLVRIYGNVIDVEAADVLADVPQRRRVPAAQAADWVHYLAQLAGPPTPAWTDAIAEIGIEIVESMGAFGLFLCGSADQADRVAALDFVAWVGPMQPEWRIGPGLDEQRGPTPVRIGVCPASEVDAVVAAVGDAGGEVSGVERADPGAVRAGTLHRYAVVSATVDAAVARNELTRMPPVRYVEHDPPPDLFDERSAQILAEDASAAAGPTVVGYTNRLGDYGVDGTGSIIAVVDSGIDNHANATIHQDLRGRFAFFVDTTSGGTTTDVDGHGTHVAAIAAGDGSTGDTDPGGFALGLGVAPGAQVGSINAIGTGGTSTDATRMQNAAQNGAVVSNNSWGFNGSGGSGYVAQCATIDGLVRDPDTSTSHFERMTMVMAAGNDGGFPQTVGRPHEAKNTIVVGNSLNSRPDDARPSDDIRGMSGRSSRGPAVDGRILPTVVAPGTDIVAARSSIDADPATSGVQPNRPAWTDSGGTVHNQHTMMSGTSMAAPHVSGAVALLAERWQDRTGQRPSPALVKALLVNTAEDMSGGPNWRAMFPAWTSSGADFTITGLGFTPAQVVEEVFSTATFSNLAQVANAAAITAPGQWAYAAGTDTLTVRTTTGGQPYALGPNNVGIWVLDPNPVAPIPNNDQGWGRVSTDNLLLSSPDSDRGPRLVVDERLAFDASGQEWNLRVAPVDSSRPLRITLAWTDAPGAAGSNPALVNDLDLEVTEVTTLNVFRGNVFANGFSTTGGAFDSVSNLECVYVQNPSGVYDVSVIASVLRGNALPPFGTATTWQDFALVIDNAEIESDTPIDVALSIDRSGSMVSSGYVDVTRTAAKGFVDLLQIDDGVGITSFATSASDDFPSTSPASIRQITAAPDRDSAKDAVDGLTFGGSTAMGQGLQMAADQLASSTNSKHVVLMSDGYDNGSPDARTVAGGLPADVDVHTLAMGTLSDEVLLEDIADATGGRYLFMPTIADLYLLVNVLREEITGDGLVANVRHTASESRVAAHVEEEANEATFLVSFDDSRVRYTDGAPEGRAAAVRLRAPNGVLMHPNEPTVRRVEGPGYVAFRVPEPIAGQWYVEVTTDRRAHTEYTVGVFVKSPIRIDVLLPQKPLRGGPFDIGVRLTDPRGPVRELSGRMCVSFPLSSVQRRLVDLRSVVRGLRVSSKTRSDLIPERFRVPTAVDRFLRRERDEALIEYGTRCLEMHRSDPVSGGTIGGGGLVVGGGTRRSVSGILGGTVLDTSLLRDIGLRGRIIDFRDIAARLRQPQLAATWPAAPHPGSYNITTTVNGVSASGNAFVRTTTRSVRLR